jgi:hypothetical protein
MQKAQDIAPLQMIIKNKSEIELPNSEMLKNS